MLLVWGAQAPEQSWVLHKSSQPGLASTTDVVQRLTLQGDSFPLQSRTRFSGMKNTEITSSGRPNASPD